MHKYPDRVGFKGEGRRLNKIRRERLVIVLKVFQTFLVRSFFFRYTKRGGNEVGNKLFYTYKKNYRFVQLESHLTCLFLLSSHSNQVQSLIYTQNTIVTLEHPS